MQPTPFPGRMALSKVPMTTAVSMSPIEDELQKSAVSQALSNQRASQVALRDQLIHLSYESVFDLSAYIRNPVDLGGPTLPTPLLSYLVPSSQVLQITKIAVVYSNPVVSQSQCVGWRVTVNGGRVPNINPVTDEYFYSSYGEVNQPLEIDPLWVQSGNLIAIEVYPRFTFNSQLTVFGRLGGRLFKTASPETVGVS
jgi:hypothetical protein